VRIEPEEMRKRIGLPPSSGLKKPIPNRRSKLVIWKEVPINCVAVSAIIEVASTAQAKIGIRNMVML
jgi:hypothetical protein